MFDMSQFACSAFAFPIFKQYQNDQNKNTFSVLDLLKNFRLGQESMLYELHVDEDPDFSVDGVSIINQQ